MHLRRLSKMVFSFGKRRILDRAADPERKGQLAIHYCGSGQTSEGVREEALLGCDLRDAGVVDLVGAGAAHAATAVDVNPTPFDIDPRTRNFTIGHRQIP